MTAPSLRGRLSSRSVLAGGESKVRLMVQVSAPSEAAQRPRLNFCLAVDRSFSMQEDHKLERARDACLAFVNALNPSDILSIVVFGTDVTVAREAQPVGTGEDARQVLHGLQARSATNLYGAVSVAAAQTAREQDPAVARCVLLLSDGVPTEGVTSDEEILKLVARAQALGIRISTIGLGWDYDEVLLSAISSGSGGAHYFVDRADDIRPALMRELGKMESLAARDLRLAVREGAGCRLTLANDRYRDRSIAVAGGWDLHLDDMERGGNQVVFFEVAIPPLPPGTVEIADLTLEFSPVMEPGAADPLRAAVPLAVTTDPTQVREGIDRYVLRRWEEMSALQKVSELVDRGRCGAINLDDVVRTIHDRSRRLYELGSERAVFLNSVAQTITAQGEITPDLAKRTVVERGESQQGEPARLP